MMLDFYNFQKWFNVLAHILQTLDLTAVVINQWTSISDTKDFPFPSLLFAEEYYS